MLEARTSGYDAQHPRSRAGGRGSHGAIVLLNERWAPTARDAVRWADSILRATPLVALMTLVTGCVQVMMSSGVVKGVELPSDLAQLLRPGMTKEETVAAIGPPETTRERDGTTTLLYREVFQDRTCRTQFLFIPLTRTSRTKKVLEVVFRGESLQRARLDVVKPNGQRETKWLVGGPGES